MEVGIIRNPPLDEAELIVKELKKHASLKEIHRNALSPQKL